ncbi:MAG TPA: acetolactate synthase large subunit, partial [Anaerolineae bacterium]|nr:acetolactate synthase large subunit [Anaerolineae bacterium]
VQAAETEYVYPDEVHLPGYRPILEGDPQDIQRAAQLINESEKPLILAGHGVILSRAHAELRQLAEKAQLPVATTLLGKSCLPESDPLCLGMAGMHGEAFVNQSVQASDLLIAIGMRFDDRVTGALATFAPQARIIHIDIDPAEIGKNVAVDVAVVGDVKRVLKALIEQVEPAKHPAWLNQIQVWRDDSARRDILNRESDRLLPQYVVREIWRATGGETLVVSDVGQNQMWEAQYFLHDRPNSLVTSGGLGTMGFALPAAIGAQVGRPEEMVWVTAGDGGFQMTIQELATVVQERLPLKIAILNNGYLGMVRQWQQLFFEGRYSGTPLLGPDFAKVAEAYGIPGFTVTERSQVTPTIQEVLNRPGPAVIDFRIEQEENVYPMVAPGGPISEMIHRPMPPSA